MEQQNQNGVVENVELNQQRYEQLMNDILVEQQRFDRVMGRGSVDEAHFLRALQPLLRLVEEAQRYATPGQYIQLQQRVVQIVRRRVAHMLANGLTRDRIEKFEHFSADESLVGDQCTICFEDLKVGTKMVRLDCHTSHYLCKTCTDNWFKEHNKCPLCNHVFH